MLCGRGLHCLAILPLLVVGLLGDSPDYASSRLMVHILHSLYREGGFDHREALFGRSLYRGSIVQNVYYADSDLCDNDVDNTKGYPARDMENGKMKPWEPPFILMVDRGSCTFVKKVRNAQHAGAVGVLIADNICVCSDQECMDKTKMTSCEVYEPILADDGSGQDISVPSFLMRKQDADAVKEELTQNRTVQIEMSWKLPNPVDRVEYALWTVPKDPARKDFLLNFKKLAVALGDRAYFTPHMYIHDGVRSHCQRKGGENFCYNLCTNNGRYCATDPDKDLENGISGADVVKESLRRLCIWSEYGETNGIGQAWWDYISEFTARCSDADFSNEDCVKDAYKHSVIDSDVIEKCIANSGGLTRDAVNNKLEAAIQAQWQWGVVVIPTVSINTVAFRGQLSATNVFAAICAGFQDGTAPTVCAKCGKCSDAPACVDSGFCSADPNYGPESGDTVPKQTFITSMLLVIGIFSGLVVWHYKRTREEMRDQLRGILAEYMPLKYHQDAGSENYKITI